MRIDQFDMERTSATHWHEVEHTMEGLARVDEVLAEIMR